MTEQSWVLRRRVPDAFLRAQSQLDPIVARILYARHLDTSEKVDAFMATDGTLGDPMSLPDMGAAIERIARALANQEQVAVYGDFDVDGVTSTVLMTTMLRALGARVQAFIPDRFEDGYGLNVDAIERLRSGGVTLCVTVDCGVRSVTEVAHARTLGMDMLITDHHSVPDTLPEAVAVIDPRREDDRYPFDELAGVGVAYQVAAALVAALGAGTSAELSALLEAQLDLVGLGTIADVVPLVGENRLLARWGLNRMRSAPRSGIAELARVSGIELATVDSGDVAFRMAPRLNAAGRIDNARIAYQLLSATSSQQAAPAAQTLHEHNRERQTLLEEQLLEASAGLEADSPPPIIFVQGENYHEGIVGLVASRLREQFYRPALVLKREEHTARGSARSIEGFHITRALESCADLLLRYGGHEQAAGFTLETDKIEAFQQGMLEYAVEHLSPDLLVARQLVDAIVTLEDVTERTPGAIAALGPFGKGNPEPLLASLGVTVLDARRMGSEGKHLRLNVAFNQVPRSCVAFRQGEAADWLVPGQSVNLLFRPSIDRWQGRESLQLVVEAVRPHR